MQIICQVSVQNGPFIPAYLADYSGSSGRAGSSAWQTGPGAIQHVLLALFPTLDAQWTAAWIGVGECLFLRTVMDCKNLIIPHSGLFPLN